MNFYAQPSAEVIFTYNKDILTASELILNGFIIGEADGIGDMTEWKG